MPVVATRDDLISGEMKRVDLQGSYVGVVNVDGAFFAFTDTCPHDGASLSLGTIEGTVLTCPKDGSQFDLNSGNVLKGPAFKRIRTYRIQIKGDDLYI
jgi:3-phenylpropionate/trans-cinnamate dioxygenase ferredoxin component